MNSEKTADELWEIFVEGQRKGHIFNVIITLVVPIGVFVMILIGLFSLNTQYTSAKQELLSNIESKSEEIKNKDNEIQNLNEAFNDSKFKIVSLQKELSEIDKKYNQKVSELNVLQKKYVKLKKQKGFTTSVSYRYKGTANTKRPSEEALSEIGN